MSEWFVYILRCADNSLYTGITKDISRRIKEHNECNEKGARYTRSRRPVYIVYTETYKHRSDASKREAVIKKLTHNEKCLLIKNDN